MLAVLVSNVVNRKKTWEEAVKQLEDFWTNEKEGLSSTPDFSKWWRNDVNGQDENNYNKVSASPEALRKYYSVKEYFQHGTPNVCTAPLSIGLDNKFGDQVDNLWFRHYSKPLEDSIVRYSKDPDSKKLRIATSWERRQPRLLVISVDVGEGKTLTFDSYHKEAEDPENSLYESDGITIDHIMSSGTLPLFYDFRDIGGRKCCDGGLLSNTPFRELLQAHQDYWMSKDKGIIPDLEVYIVNVHPSKQVSVAEDHDGVKDRINDITFLDRNSYYDENVVNTETDHLQLIDKLKDLAKSYIGEDREKIGSFESEFNNFLTTVAKSKSYTGKSRTFQDLLKGRFNLIKVIRIEPTHYADNISGKVADFTFETIKSLITQGANDALKVLNLKCI